MSTKNLLLTGASGLLGSNLLQHLLQEDFHIFAVKRPDSDLSFCPKSEKISWITTNDISANFLRSIQKPIHYIVHAAGMVSYLQKDKARLFEVNYEFTRNISEKALGLNVEKFILISSISAIGKDSSSHVITEETPWNDQQFASNYGRSKRAAEEAVRGNGKKGLPWIILNPSVIIGPAKTDQSSAKLIAYIADKKPFYTDGILNYVAVDDVSRIIIKSLKSNLNQQQMIINTGSVSYKDFFTEVASCLNTEAPKYRIPKAGVMVGAVLENIYSKLTGKKPTLSMETARMAGGTHIYKADKLNEKLQIKYTPLKESIKNTVTAMKINGFLKTIFFLASLVDFSI